MHDLLQNLITEVGFYLGCSLGLERLGLGLEAFFFVWEI